MKRIYLDNAATGPVKKEVLEAMLPYLQNDFGNPSSIHSWGQTAKGAIEIAREQVAKFLNADPQEIIFTSGGTEADNLAIRGVVNASNGKFEIRNSKFETISKSKKINSKQTPHIITTQIEHHAVIRTCEELEKEGLAEVTYLKPNRQGLITVAQVEKALKPNTILVSIMYVNNEIGTVQNIRDIGKMIERINKQRNSRIYFHTDAVQAAEYQPMNVDYLHVDMLTLSGHKIGAPKGIGALYRRKGIPAGKILFGGEQERNARAGTENTSGIVALGKAVEVLGKEKREKRVEKVRKLRDYFINRVLQEIPEVELNGDQEKRSPNNANFYFKYVEGESILLSLDLEGIAASSGSACTSLSLQPSHVLMAVYDNAERSHGSVRFTLGVSTTKAEIDYTISKLKQIIGRLRQISPLTKGK